MSLRVIHGKPGSGKSCYCVSLMIKMLSDWARYKIDKGETYPRILYTNIPLDVEAVNEYLSAEMCTKIDISNQIEVLDDTFFRDKNGNYCDWWEKFEEKAFIAIDEVHLYLPASLKLDKSGKDLAGDFVNYISTHRHRQHDLIFLTQHLSNITPEIKRMAEVAFEVLNVKNVTVGFWPFLIQMADIDVVRESWGFPLQLAHIKRGQLEEKCIRYDKNYEVFVLNSSLFKLYRSHTMSEEALDRPSLRLGKFGSILWFAHRYGMKFLMWAILLIVAFVSAKNVLAALPQAVTHSLVKTAPSASPADSAVPVVKPEPFEPGHYHVDDPAKSTATELPMEADIIGFFPGRVITRKCTLGKDDHIMIDGEKDFVQNVDVLRGILYLGSGKKVQR